MGYQAIAAASTAAIGQALPLLPVEPDSAPGAPQAHPRVHLGPGDGQGEAEGSTCSEAAGHPHCNPGKPHSPSRGLHLVVTS